MDDRRAVVACRRFGAHRGERGGGPERMLADGVARQFGGERRAGIDAPAHWEQYPAA